MQVLRGQIGEGLCTGTKISKKTAVRTCLGVDLAAFNDGDEPTSLRSRVKGIVDIPTTFRRGQHRSPMPDQTYLMTRAIPASR